MVDFGLVTLKMTCDVEMPISFDPRVSREPVAGTTFHFTNTKCDCHVNTGHLFSTTGHNHLQLSKDQSRLVFNGSVQKNQTLDDSGNWFWSSPSKKGKKNCTELDL